MRKGRVEWSLEAELMAITADYLGLLLWTKTKDGQKNRNQPKPIPRPSNNFNRKQKGRLKGAVMLPTDELARRLALPREASRN